MVVECHAFYGCLTSLFNFRVPPVYNLLYEAVPDSYRLAPMCLHVAIK